MSAESNKNRSLSRCAVMARAADLLEAAGPGDLQVGARPSRPKKLVARKWDELIRELRRRSKKAWRTNPKCAENLPTTSYRRKNGE